MLVTNNIVSRTACWGIWYTKDESFSWIRLSLLTLYLYILGIHFLLYFSFLNVEEYSLIKQKFALNYSQECYFKNETILKQKSILSNAMKKLYKLYSSKNIKGFLKMSIFGIGKFLHNIQCRVNNLKCTSSNKKNANWVSFGYGRISTDGKCLFLIILEQSRWQRIM